MRNFNIAQVDFFSSSHFDMRHKSEFCFHSTWKCNVLSRVNRIHRWTFPLYVDELTPRRCYVFLLFFYWLLWEWRIDSVIKLIHFLLFTKIFPRIKLNFWDVEVFFLRAQSTMTFSEFSSHKVFKITRITSKCFPINFCFASFFFLLTTICFYTFFTLENKKKEKGTLSKSLLWSRTGCR